MSDHTWFIIAMVIYLIAMLSIGIWSYFQTDEYEDYMVGGRGLNPFVAALSAGASDMSGWLLMGLPGAIFVSGFSELWIAIGLLIGSWCNWKWIAPRLRSYTEIARNSITIPSFLENRLRDRSHTLRILSGIIILVFFTFYVSSGMVAGGRYFESSFDGDYFVGLAIIGVVTVLYTFVGGFLAVSYTDVVQGSMMFLALVLVPTFAILHMDNPGDIFTFQTEHAYGALESIPANSQWFSLFSGVSFIAIISNLAWGLGYFGQPHIIVRFMAMRKPSDATAGRRWGVGWMALCLVGAVFIAIVGPAFFAEGGYDITDTKNYETNFLDMASILFHPLIAGLILTAVLAAIMSTVSSQLLVVASALVEDIYAGLINKSATDTTLKNLSRAMIIIVAVIAALVALDPDSAILGLVEFAWAGFGASFGPVIIAALFWRRLNVPGAVAGMAGGALVAFIWGGLPQFNVMDKPFGLYEMIPGVAVNVLLLIIVSLRTAAPDDEVTTEFDEATRLARLAESDTSLDIASARELILAEDGKSVTS
ncbi:sodium/proline symporter PutP [Corynebacterium terpenotabidum]|uniref:Sodium/proline symporter n=1 Tax=Corynebacterium terpenotabidum Y-11 TaxID=1200352 RepID=S4XEZ4_9CORY|nr:sodium/proline symporter PutP [Corynebacterium terpenotabidum]AGP31144.1 sodium/proline symporter family protein [Corynebacterium terpenotabidum Y-11]